MFNVSDVVRHGDSITVKVISIDEQNRIKLSKKAIETDLDENSLAQNEKDVEKQEERHEYREHRDYRQNRSNRDSNDSRDSRNSRDRHSKKRKH